jgi:hypothetical protein
MSIGLLFWVIMVIWVIFFGAWRFQGQSWPWAPHANTILFFILFFLLGWRTFGFIIQG